MSIPDTDVAYTHWRIWDFILGGAESKFFGIGGPTVHTDLTKQLEHFIFTTMTFPTFSQATA